MVAGRTQVGAAWLAAALLAAPVALAAPATERALPASPQHEAARLIATGAAQGDGLGWSVAVDGDTVVAGAPYPRDRGAAYVFVRPRSGWTGLHTQSATLVAPRGTERFGWSVAVSGRTIVVGAPGHFEEPGIHPPGDAYIYVEPRSGWHGRLSPAARLTPTTLAAGDVLGDAVAATGRTVVVSAPGAGGSDQGVAYVFDRPRSGWRGTRRQAATLRATDGHRLDLFGNSVAALGDTVAVAARQHRVSPRMIGVAYVFVRPSSGWSGVRGERARLKSSERTGTFGASVGIAGDAIAVGAGSSGYSGPYGDASVFERPSGGWSGARTPDARLRVPSRAAAGTCGVEGELGADHAIGTAVAAAADGRIIVSTSPHGVGGHHYLGKACVFDRPPAGWSGTLTGATTLTPSDGRENDLFAGSGSPSALAISGDTVVAGGYRHRIRGHEVSGEVYVFQAPAPPDG